MSLTLVVVGKDHAAVRAFDLAHIDATDIVLVANTGRVPLSVIGNHYLDHARTEILGLVHADCWFGPGATERFAEAAQSAVCGIVGLDLGLTYRWSATNPADVSTLDSCSVFLRRDGRLGFDERTFDSLHCHVEDICLQAKEAGIPVIVPAADATHRSATANGQAWLNEYRIYRKRLGKKWEGVEFVTT